MIIYLLGVLTAAILCIIEIRKSGLCTVMTILGISIFLVGSWLSVFALVYWMWGDTLIWRRRDKIPEPSERFYIGSPDYTGNNDPNLRFNLETVPELRKHGYTWSQIIEISRIAQVYCEIGYENGRDTEENERGDY